VTATDDNLELDGASEGAAMLGMGLVGSESIGNEWAGHGANEGLDWSEGQVQGETMAEIQNAIGEQQESHGGFEDMGGDMGVFDGVGGGMIGDAGCAGLLDDADIAGGIVGE
jgi:hypothetical protein